MLITVGAKAWFTLRHKHKHKHDHKHNESSHLLHTHKESDIRKRNELQNEAAGVWDDSRFQNWDFAYAYVTPGLHTYFSDISIRKWKRLPCAYAYVPVSFPFSLFIRNHHSTHHCSTHHTTSIHLQRHGQENSDLNCLSYTKV